ncbi:hypothetical protein D5H75_19850 [Bailinhaonella thermotolerans]|uniref:Lipoprotein n=1 Tax=Bailinhaonella thermotolerans TaxID=1070861 RepID=A0A3A4ANR7_9ACTN|nr:hypothetical protein D5H75_19850 [Bailinhaonella thermotolerans]
MRARLAGILILGSSLATAAALGHAGDQSSRQASGRSGNASLAASTRPTLAAPPTRAELTRATELLIAHPKLGRSVAKAYKEATGEKLDSAADLRPQGSLFHAAQLRKTNEDLAACGSQRCVQLFVRLPDGSWAETDRVVVNLARSKVERLKW